MATCSQRQQCLMQVHPVREDVGRAVCVFDGELVILVHDLYGVHVRAHDLHGAVPYHSRGGEVKAPGAEDTSSVWRDHDCRADFAGRGRALEDLDGVASKAESDGGGEAGDAAANDEDGERGGRGH